MSPVELRSVSATPLLGADAIDSHPDARVLVIEESDARPKLSGNGLLIVAYNGAPQRWGWPALKGRQVDILPAATAQAWQQALTIKGYLVSLDCQAAIIDTRHEPDSWEIADFAAEGGTAATLPGYCERHRETSQPALIGAPEPLQALVREIHDEPLPQFTEETQAWLHFGLEKGPGGRPWPNLDTAVRVLSQHPEYRTSLWFDEFKGRAVFAERDVDDEGDAEDLALIMQRDIHVSHITVNTVQKAINTFARRNSRHPVKEYLASLPAWDGQNWGERLLPLGFGTQDDDYFRAVGTKFMIGMVRRIEKPGCKLDNLPVFEGEEGIKKSGALQRLAEPWYFANNESIKNKDFLQNMAGYWLVEIPEMHSFSGVEQEQIKGKISDPQDVYRGSYGRLSRPHLRQSVFAGTTNRSDWNHSTTGARRFWPVECGTIELEWISEHREQLFAEAMVRCANGEDHWDIPLARAREEQANRHVMDPWTAAIGEMLLTRSECTIEDCYLLVGLELKDRERKVSVRIGEILRALGWKDRRENVRGVTTQVFRPKERP